MLSDAQKWNQRYRSGTHPASDEPAPLLREVLPLLPRGRALDLAMGAGRNAVFLAANGWRVTGIDCSRAALEKAEALAREHGINVHWAGAPAPEASRRDRPVSPPLPGILLIEADLVHFNLPATRFELVVCFNYLERSLFRGIEDALRPGGVLVYETSTLDQLAFSQGPHNPQHLLRPHELREAFPGLETLFYREFCAGKGIASLVARKR